MSYRISTVKLALAAVMTIVIAISMAPLASAGPDTPVAYPAGFSATVATGRGFDTCTAPSTRTLRAWLASPYRTVNIYFGGINRGCAQPNLTAAWVRDTTALGWSLLPTYMGSQPACILGNKKYRYDRSTAGPLGIADAKDAVAKAKALGLLPGSALYADVEHYDRTSSTCVIAVQRYVGAWTQTLHAAGYLAGVYVHQDSGLRDLNAIYLSPSYARPDAIWMARWDGNPALTDWPTAPNNRWANHQRAKQYIGDHTETWGGVPINIDSDAIDAPVATVARAYRATNTTPLNSRTGPATSYAGLKTYTPGASLHIVCQGIGQKIGNTAVWDQLSDGSWVSDFYVSTPSQTTFSDSLPRCTYPGQVTSAIPLTARTGPGTSFRVTGAPLQPGSLAYVVCQKDGSAVGSTEVWNRLTDGRWVSGYYVAHRSDTTSSASVPRCH